MGSQNISITAAELMWSVCVYFYCVTYVLRLSSRALLEQMHRASASAGCWNKMQQSAEFSTEQTGSHVPKQQHNFWFIFKNKTKKKNLKKETNTSFSSNPLVGNTSCL